MAAENREHPIISKLKAYLFPSLVSFLALMIWRDISEMRADVKMLLAQSNIDKTKIENLQQDVKRLEDIIYNKKTTHARASLPWFMSVYFKPEEEYSIEEHLNTNDYA